MPGDKTAHNADLERLTAGDFATVLMSVGPVCTCCQVCADKASDLIMFALDKRGWAIVDEQLIDGSQDA
jgi:hypothetical protein